MPFSQSSDHEFSNSLFSTDFMPGLLTIMKYLAGLSQVRWYDNPVK
jgi:hypothetical protein